MKVVYSHLRQRGHALSGYIDDILLQGDTYQECQNNINDTLLLMDSCGLTVHTKKSVITPVQSISHLGFILNSTNMTVCLTKEKAQKLKVACLNILRAKTILLELLQKLLAKW